MTLEQIRQLKMILASDRVRVGGQEVMSIASLLTALQAEENRLTMALRQKPKPEGTA
jgi:hypothetical protein